MPIRDFLSIDAPENEFPTTNQLQREFIELLADNPTPPGDTDIATFTALAITGLESQMRELEAELRDSNTQRSELLTRLIDLETRILQAGVHLPAAR